MKIINKIQIFYIVAIIFSYAIFFFQNIALAQDEGDYYTSVLELGEFFPIRSNQWIELENGIIYLNIKKSWKEKINTQPDLNVKENTSSEQELALPEEKTVSVSIHAIRFDLELYDFSVYSAKWNNNISLSIEEWLDKENLVAGINASMYLQDGLTSNGYLRKGDLLNNKHIGKKLGGFFVANPKDKNSILPKAAIIYNDEDFSRFGENSLQDVLENYHVVVQNFKLLHNIKYDFSPSTTLDNNNWKSSRQHSIAAIAEDFNGKIIFLFSEQAITVQEFITAIQNDENLKLKRAIYTEGGSQASMGLRVDKIQKFWFGQNNILLMFTGYNKIPNIIGVQKNNY